MTCKKTVRHSRKRPPIDGTPVKPMLYTATYPSPLGALTLACGGEGLAGLWMEGQKYFGAGLSGPMEEKPGAPALRAARQWLDAYFAGQRPEAAALPLAPAGGPFRQAVWAALREIPYGEVTSYGELAQRLAARLGIQSMAARAVGGAVGHNPISIIIPCHRVLGAGGRLVGYAGGLERKTWLLEWEGAVIPGM